jgi:cephalosporin-C deacetylase-like acetyl esterase
LGGDCNAASISGGNSLKDDVTELMEELFAYDKDLPLDAVEREVETEKGEGACFHVAFSSVHDQRVPALLTLPTVSPPYPVVLILHGVFGHKTSYNQIKRSAALVAAGYATLRIDGQYSGDRKPSSGNGIGIQGKHYYRNRDAMVQTVVDVRRGMDYLSTRNDIEAARVGLAGFSMGGAIGAIASALDSRVKAVVLGITGGDFKILSARVGDETAQTRVRHAYRVVDPINYVSRISPRPLLMLSAANDEIIPRASTEALYKAAGEPKRNVWYDCGHANLPDEYLAEMVAFFDSEMA